MKPIVLDTNILMAIAQFKLDVFAELKRICDFKYDISVLSGTIDELKAKAKEPRSRAAARFALNIIEKKRINIIENSAYVDDALVELSKKGYLIATLDMELKRKLKKPYITIRNQSQLVIL